MLTNSLTAITVSFSNSYTNITSEYLFEIEGNSHSISSLAGRLIIAPYSGRNATHWYLPWWVTPFTWFITNVLLSIDIPRWLFSEIYVPLCFQKYNGSLVGFAEFARQENSALLPSAARIFFGWLMKLIFAEENMNYYIKRKCIQLLDKNSKAKFMLHIKNRPYVKK